MAEHDDELGFFFCENCGHVQKSGAPYEKLTEECSHCHFSTWIWEPNEDGDATFTLQCSCSRKIEGIVGGALAADVLHCDCGKTWIVSSGTAVEETEYTHTRVDRLAALERLYEAARESERLRVGGSEWFTHKYGDDADGLTKQVAETGAAYLAFLRALACLARMEAEING